MRSSITQHHSSLGMHHGVPSYEKTVLLRCRETYRAIDVHFFSVRIVRTTDTTEEASYYVSRTHVRECTSTLRNDWLSHYALGQDISTVVGC